MGAKKWHGVKRGYKWSAFVYARVKLRFPRVTNMGIYNCRKIAGSSSWSQHSWSNALDIGVPNRDYGNQVNRWLEQRKGRLNIEHKLWWVADHYDHIHMDWFPNHTGVPPCGK